MLRHVAWAAPVVLAGCLAVSDPPPDLASREVPERARFAADEAAAAGEVLDDWLRTFDDPALHELVQRAWARNPDLGAAAANVDAAFARLREAAGLLYPRVDATGGVRRSDSGAFQGGISPEPIFTSPVTTYSLGLEISWEADLWGRLRAGERAALGGARAAAWDFVQARHSLAAAVATAFYAITAAREQLAIDEQLLAAEEFTLRTTSQRAAVGVATALDEGLAAASVELARSAIEQDRQALAEARRALDLLLGDYPAGRTEAAAALPPVAPLPPAGVPAELLRRRPDVLAAEQRAVAAFHLAEQARAAMLPSLTIAVGGGTLIDPDELFWSLAANVLGPLFRGGSLAARLDAASAEQRGALHRYAAAALQAFREVEDALAGERQLAAREQHLRIASERLQAASAAAHNRYEEGLLTIVDLQQVRRQDFQTRAQLVGVRFERLRQRLALHLALGGAVESDASPRAVATAAGDEEHVDG